VRAEGVELDNFEAQLSEVETEAAKAFTAILGGRSWPPTTDQRLAVSAWIGLQHLRGTNNRRMVEEMHRALAQLEVGIATTVQLREHLAAPDEASNDEVEAARAHLLATIDTLPVDHHAHLASIGDALAPAIMAVFDRQPWIVVEFTWDALGTSDTPVVIIPDEAAIAGIRGVGIGSAPELYVPLSARVALCMGGNGAEEPDAWVTGSAELAGKRNRNTLHNSRRAVYYHPDSDPFTGFTMPPIRERELDTSQISNLIPKEPHEA
jgi:hypothetical protein